MEDVRTKRGTDIALGHQLVAARLKSKLKKHWVIKQAALQMLNITFFRDANKLRELKIALNNMSQVLQGLIIIS